MGQSFESGSFKHFWFVAWYLKTRLTVLWSEILMLLFSSLGAKNLNESFFSFISFSSYLLHLSLLPLLWDRIWLAKIQIIQLICLKSYSFMHQQSSVCWERDQHAETQGGWWRRLPSKIYSEYISKDILTVWYKQGTKIPKLVKSVKRHYMIRKGKSHWWIH